MAVATVLGDDRIGIDQDLPKSFRILSVSLGLGASDPCSSVWLRKS
jgi:hypothetical protein